MDFLTHEELNALPFKSVGKNVLISRNVFILGHENIVIGNNVRIDYGCKILAATGQFKLGSHIHLACDSRFYCAGGITLEDFTNVAANCTFLSSSDDFSGDSLIGPMVPSEHRYVYKSRIILEPHAVVGVGCVLSPGTTMLEGSALGTMSFTKKDQLIAANSIWAGQPAKFIKERSVQNRRRAYDLERIRIREDSSYI